MRIAISLLAVSILAVGPVHAANDKVQRGPVPDWVAPSELMPAPDGSAGLVFVRRNDMFVHLDEQGRTQYQGFRAKILHSNALQVGNLSLAWDPSGGAPVVHVVRVHRQNEAIDVLKTTSFEILRREDQLEAATLDGVLTAIMRVPDLRVGDELEVAWTTRFKDPTLGAIDNGILFLSSEPPPGRHRLKLSWDPGHEPHLKMTPDMLAAAQRGTRAVTFQFDNPAALIPPKDAPFRFKWQRIVEYSDYADWAAISRYFAPLYSQAAKLDSGSPLKDEARRIAAAHSSPLERASAALKLVQQEVRYIYVGLDGGNLKPASAKETWQRRYGDCKGKTALLLGLLAELGIEAHPVLVNNAGSDDGLNERLPSPGMFDHVLVQARIDGADYWLDGTLPPVAGPSRTAVMPYRWTLPLTAQGSSIERIDWRPPSQPDSVTLHEIDARAGFDQPARITSSMIVRGIKGLQQQVQFSALTPTQLLSSLRQQMVGDTWQTIDKAEWRYDQRSQASVLTIAGTGPVDWDDDGGGAKSLTLPGGGFSPPERRTRPADQNQNLPYANEPEFACHVTTLRLPKSTQPSHWSFNSTFDTRLFGRNYYRTFELRDGAIRMIRGSRVEQREVDAATAMRDNAKIASFDNSMASASYDPAGGGSRSKTGKSVPATYEIDWTAGNVPCLSPSTAY